MSYTDLLNQTAASDFIRKVLPEAAFIAKIVKADILPRYWGPKEGKRTEAEYALCYAATFEIVDYLYTGDSELDAQNEAQLKAFGDWRGIKLSNNYRGAVPTLGKDRIMLSGVGPGNYELGSCDPYFGSNPNEQFFEPSPRLAMFAESKPDGTTGGFVSLLSQDPKVMEAIKLPKTIHGDNLMKAIAATEGAYVVIEVGIEKSEEYGDRNTIAGISSIS